MVDSFKWLPPSMAAYYRARPIEKQEVPWAPLKKPLNQCRFSVVTTGGVYVKGKQPPFDVERERREPFWGDPTYRVIPRDVRQEEIGVAHLHINTSDIEEDVNIVLPIHRFLELEEAGEIGSLAPSSYSLMGFQWNQDEWRDRYGPEIAARMKEEAVDAALITPV
ncbi:MAG: glycine/sarcosine/betaine reductase selenoprotein B family protein [Dehalococcoidia bacterium]|nr:glycine/sarcosine/betaine reductase selenoprotein B family protein [Dehalococcoidia bacterium]